MEWVLANYPELIADETIVQQRIKPGILSLKSKGNALRKRFFISDGTLLGWYRQCGIILQSQDVDFSMLWTEYDKKIHNTFLGNKDLYLFTEYGLDPGRKELRLRSDEYTFDLFGQENNYRCLRSLACNPPQQLLCFCSNAPLVENITGMKVVLSTSAMRCPYFANFLVE
ncbi:hypothetical protein GJ496_005496 [Pomphorhynchus laevis]|nr:hypothetical protein GJ496_005496 [Pomphorhynchus laevis]